MAKFPTCGVTRRSGLLGIGEKNAFAPRSAVPQPVTFPPHTPCNYSTGSGSLQAMTELDSPLQSRYNGTRE